MLNGACCGLPQLYDTPFLNKLNSGATSVARLDKTLLYKCSIPRNDLSCVMILVQQPIELLLPSLISDVVHQHQSYDQGKSAIFTFLVVNKLHAWITQVITCLRLQNVNSTQDQKLIYHPGE